MSGGRWWFLPILAWVFIACGERPPNAGTAGETEILLDSGEAHYWLGQYDSARLVWGEALERATVTGDSVIQAEVLTWLGLAAMRGGDYVTARSEGEAALELKLGFDQKKELARSYNALGLLADREDRLLDALRLYERTMTAARAEDDERMAAVAAGNLGLIHAYLGDLERGSSLLRQMRDGASALEDPRLEGNALTNLGMVAVWSGDPQAALTSLHAASAFYEKFGDYPLGEQHVLAQRATALSDMGRYDEAMAALDSALALARLHGMSDQEAENRRLLGSVFADLGDHRRALLHYEDAADAARSLGMDSEVGNISRLAAITHLALGSVDRALESGEEALTAHRASGEPFEELDDLLVIADIRRQMDTGEDGQAALRSARLLAEQLDARSAHTAVALAEARHEEAAGAHRQVLAAAGRARDASMEADYRARTEIHGLAARAYAGLGRMDSAAAEGLAAVRALDRVRSDLASNDLRGSFASASSHLYGDVVLILLQEGRSEEAFAVADGARSRELLHRLTMFATPPDEDSSSSDPVVPSGDLAAAELLLRRIDALLAQLHYLETVPPEERSPGSSATSIEVLRRIDKLRDEYEGLVIRSARLPERSTGILGGRGADEARVRAALAPDEALLHYTLTRDQLILFVARRDAFQTVRIPVAAEDLASRIRLVRALLGSRGAKAARGFPSAEALHELLIRPAIGTGLLSDVDRLLIVPHGVVEQLPFALLRDPSTSRFLVEDYVLSYVPSAGAVPALRDTPRHPRELLVSSGFAPFPDALPGTEGEAIAAQQTAPKGRLYRGHQATEAAVRGALTGSAVVHIASHGVLNARNPLFSRIDLAPGAGTSSADDGRLEVHEVLELSVRSQLVVLSGCETALAEEWSGNPLRPAGIATLSQAFLQAGAMNVLATLWRIDDTGSADLVRRLYKMEATEDVAGALALAQREMIGHPRYGAPYYWAGYIMAGAGRSGPFTHGRPADPLNRHSTP